MVQLATWQRPRLVVYGSFVLPVLHRFHSPTLRSWSWWCKWFQKMFWHWGERFWCSRKNHHLFFQLTSSDSVVYGFCHVLLHLLQYPPIPRSFWGHIDPQLFVFTLSPCSMKARPRAPADSKAGTARTAELKSRKVVVSLVTFCGSPGVQWEFAQFGGLSCEWDLQTMPSPGRNPALLVVSERASD